MATVEGPHLMPGEGCGLGMDLLEKMLDGLEDYDERFDQSLGRMDFSDVSSLKTCCPSFAMLLQHSTGWTDGAWSGSACSFASFPSSFPFQRVALSVGPKIIWAFVGTQGVHVCRYLMLNEHHHTRLKNQSLVLDTMKLSTWCIPGAMGGQSSHWTPWWKHRSNIQCWCFLS